jgi:hypothetical protein
MNDERLRVCLVGRAQSRNCRTNFHGQLSDIPQKQTAHGIRTFDVKGGRVFYEGLNYDIRLKGERWRGRLQSSN